MRQMGSDKFTKSMEVVLRWEGGYVNHPEDPGGITNMGITKRTLERWLDKEVDAQRMLELTKPEVYVIYRDWYWGECKCEDLPYGVDLCVFDFGVNAGPVRAQKFLQQNLTDCAVDGIIGPKTLAKVNELTVPELEKLVDSYHNDRMDYYRSLGTFGTFGKGWTNRAVDVLKIARGMIHHNGEVQ